MLYQVLIGLLFILQAAHQPPAGAGDLGGIEGEVLGLCHLNGYRLELVQELGTAEGPAADAQAAQHLGLVPHTDLPQLDAGMDGAGQVLHQGPEVHPAFRREEEEHLVSLKAVLRLHQLHLQAVGGDLLLTDLEGLCLLLPVFFHRLLVFLRGDAYQWAQGLDHSLLLHLGVPLSTLSVFQAPGGLHDHSLSRLHLQPGGVKIILLSAAFEADADDLYHKVLLLLYWGSHGVGTAPRREGVTGAETSLRTAIRPPGPGWRSGPPRPAGGAAARRPPADGGAAGSRAGGPRSGSMSGPVQR